MNIAVIGTGNVGRTLGSRWAANGHQVTFGALDPFAAEVNDFLQISGATARATSVEEAAVEAEIVLLAVPWSAAYDVIASLGNLENKILIDCINPTNAELTGLTLGYNTSAGEEIAGWAKGAHVVKAFNTNGVANMENAVYGSLKATMFMCGDNEQAKTVVADLAGELDFEVVDSGPLECARYLEPLAMLAIHLAVHQGFAPDFAFKVLTR